MTTISVSTIQIKRSSTPGTFPTSLMDGEEFVNLADGFRVMGDGVTAPNLLPRIPFVPATALPLSDAQQSALNGKADTSALAGKLDAAGDGSGLFVTLGSAQQALPAAIGARVLAALAAATLTVGPVPATFPTVQAAYASLDSQLLGRTGQILFQVAAGFVDHAATVVIDRPDASRIIIQGQAPTTTALTGISGVTGGPGAYSVTATFGSTVGMFVGGIVQISGTAGASGLHYLHRGAWRVASVTNGTTAVLTNTVYNQTPPTGVTGSATIYKSHLRFAPSINAFDVAALGGMTNVAVIGRFANDNTIGIWSKSFTNCGQGRTILGPNLAVCGFGAEGVRSNYIGGITATSVVASSNGNNGFMGRNMGQMALFGCLSSGNGTFLPPGGGNGLLVQNTSSVYAVSFEGYGNAGYGQFARSGGEILNQNGQSARVVGNAVGFGVVWGFLQDEAGIAAFNGNDYYNDNGRLFVPSASSSNAQGNAVVTTNAGVTTANAGFVLTAALFNGFVASAGGQIDATSSNVVSVGGTPYYENVGGTVISSGAVGMTGRFSVDFGRVIQSVSASPYIANADLTTVIPLDDTVPQNTEGTQILSLTITPTSVTSKIRLRFRGEATKSATGALVGAIFRGGQVNALRAGYTSVAVANQAAELALEVDDAPATASPVTYAVRVGPDSGTLRLNGSPTARLFGGTSAATLIAEEIKG